MPLEEAQIVRYARQLVLPEIGGQGQESLLSARVLIVGAGGLGCPLALYLGGSGLGKLGIVDDDVIEESNLHRQIAFERRHSGARKAEMLAERVAAINPDCRPVAISRRLQSSNAEDIFAGFDIIADGSDNLATRQLVHDTAMRLGKPLVSASVQGLDGQLSVFRAFDGVPFPCMHCSAPAETDETLLPTCAAGGVLGPAAGVMGGMQAIEVIKLVLRLETPLDRATLLYDARSQETLTITNTRAAGCRFCSSLPTK